MPNLSFSTVCPRALLVAFCTLMVSPAWSTYVVLGTANPNLAGRDLGYICCAAPPGVTPSGPPDTLPGEAPLLVTGFAFSAGDNLQFTVSGRTSFGPALGLGSNPDGDYGDNMYNYGDGISGALRLRVNSLVGVFLSDSSPTGSTTPDPLDFAYQLDFASLAPGLGQIFFIGDGLTGYSGGAGPAGTRQIFTVPVGATRLFLGDMDGYGWFNNIGSFNVDIGRAGDGNSVPTPGSLSLVAAALGMLALARRRPGAAGARQGIARLR